MTSILRRLGPGRLRPLRVPTHTRVFSNATLPAKNPFLRIADEVQEAISTNKPVVALESAIYTHGFPYPENVALASQLESLVRLNGGVPATIGVLGGIAGVGLMSHELDELASSAGKVGTRKLSRRDLGYICGLGTTSRKLNGGTTIAGTMVLAHLAGIKVFATGGLGGVHRGGENSMDVSADLTELGRTPVAVISSGCKSFLDIPRTLEYLETQGVGVGTFADGREGNVDFPAFWTRDSGTPSPVTINDEKEAAAIIYAQNSLPISSGLFFASPIPEQHSIPKLQMDAVMAQAIHDAEESGSRGSDNTPFVLARIRDLTGGQTIAANRALVEANVVRGSKVASELCRLEAQGANVARSFPPPLSNKDSVEAAPAQDVSESGGSASEAQSSVTFEEVDVIVAGALAIDLSCDLISREGANASPIPQLKTSNPASISQGLGGVGQNVATALHHLGTSVRLCSIIGDDIAGTVALDLISARGLSTSGIVKKQSLRTAQYVAINDANKDLTAGMADFNIFERGNGELDATWKEHLQSSKLKWIVLDANWDSQTLKRWIAVGTAAGAKIAFEPVSVAKSRRLFEADEKAKNFLTVVPEHCVSIAAPNSLELASMHAAARDTGLFERDEWWRLIDAIGLSSSGSRDKLAALTSSALVDEGIPQQSVQLLPFIPSILTKLGERGVLMTRLLKPGDARLTSPTHAQYVLSRADTSNSVIGGVYMRLFPPAETLSRDAITSVNGVGDTFLGIIISGLVREDPRPLDEVIAVAQQGSVMTLKSHETVNPAIADLTRLL